LCNAVSSSKPKKVGMRNGLSVKARIEKWLDDSWDKSKTREEICRLLDKEYTRGRITREELKSVIKDLYTSKR